MVFNRKLRTSHVSHATFIQGVQTRYDICTLKKQRFGATMQSPEDLENTPFRDDNSKMLMSDNQRMKLISFRQGHY